MRNLHSLFVISLGNRVPGTNNKGYFIAFLVRSLKTRKAFAGPEGRPALLFYLTRPRFLSSMYDSLQWVLVVAAIRRSSPLLLLLVSRQREHLELRESSSKKWLINWPATSGLLDPLYISIYTIFPLNPSPWPESWKRFANLLVSFSIVIGSRLFVLEFPPTHSTIPPARNIGEPATNLDSFPCSFLFPFFFPFPFPTVASRINLWEGGDTKSRLPILLQKISAVERGGNRVGPIDWDGSIWLNDRIWLIPDLEDCRL